MTTLLSLPPRLYDVPEGPRAEGQPWSENRETEPSNTNGSEGERAERKSGERAECKTWGAVYFDGRDVREWKLADLRRAIALVPQQALLFEGTIRTNMLYANPDATLAQIRLALEIADFAATVDALPSGLDTAVGERGVSLSGGQRQRLALARAIVAEPAVLLLDDCTSALDAETEARIQQALDRHLPGRTCVIVSHKVSSVRRCDLIVVLEDGQVIEQGTHEELLALHGRYAATYAQQTRALILAAGR
jgi:ABC-type multidrug transport system fused ATPase/permease subunit